MLVFFSTDKTGEERVLHMVADTMQKLRHEKRYLAMKLKGQKMSEPRTVKKHHWERHVHAG